MIVVERRGLRRAQREVPRQHHLDPAVDGTRGIEDSDTLMLSCLAAP